MKNYSFKLDVNELIVKCCLEHYFPLIIYTYIYIATNDKDYFIPGCRNDNMIKLTSPTDRYTLMFVSQYS